MARLRERYVLEYPLCVQRSSAREPSPLCCRWGAWEPLLAACVAYGGRYVSLYGIAWFGGFDGPFVALLPAAVHPPWRDEFYDRERRKVSLAKSAR